jgi:TetR/AcrR family transcriptional regulator, regulator of biofilm formation and stress response
VSETQKHSAAATRTRAKVLAATIDLIYELGLGGITHRKIAERAGVPLGTTTYHFESLTQLIELAIRQELNADSKRRKDVLQRSVAGADIVTWLLELMLPQGSDQPHILANVNVRLSEIQLSIDFRHLVKELQFEVESDIANLLVQSGIDSSHAGTVLALLDGFLLQWLIYEKPLSWLSGQLSKALRDLGISL